MTIFGRGQKDPKTLPRSHPSGNPEIAAVLARAMLRGGLAIAEGELIWMQRTDGPSSKASVMSPVVRMRRNGTIVDTLAMLLARSASDMTLTVRRKPFGVMRQPFNIQSYWAARSDGGGIVVVEVPKEPAECPLQCTIRVFDANGRQTMTRRYSPAPTVITKRMVDSAVSALATRITPRDSSAANEILRGELVASIRAQILVPKYEAPVTHLLFGNDGSIWIRGPDHTVGGPTWTIFESSGRQVGRMRIPENLHVAYADLERILAVETDDDGIPWIVQLKVVR